MASAAGTDIWAVLLPVLIGGVLAVIGGAVGPAVGHVMVARAAERSRRRERLEAFIFAISEQPEWLEVKLQIELFQREGKLAPEPLIKALAIATIYFPDLIEPLSVYRSASLGYQRWIAEATLRRMKKEGDMKEGYEPVYNSFSKAHAEFVKQVAEYALANRKRL